MTTSEHIFIFLTMIAIFLSFWNELNQYEEEQKDRNWK